MKGKLTDVGDGSHAKNISASDLIETEGAKFNAVSGVDRNHNDVNNSADHVDYKLKRMDDNVGPFSHANDGDCSKNNWSSLVTNGDSVTTVNCSSHIELDDCNELQRGSKGGMQSINEEDKLFQSTNSNDKSVYSGKNHKNDESHIQSSNSTWLEEGFSTIGPKLDVNTDQGHFRDNKLTAKDVSNTGLGRSKSFRMQNNAHVVTSRSEIASNRIDRAESGRMQGYGSMRKSQELCGRSGSSILSGEGLAKSNQEKSNFNRQRSLSFSNEPLQVQRNTTESETCKDVRNFANDLALKDSPSRVHNRMENLRVRGSTSADSSSSHGGSSHSGSPIAEEYCRDSRTSSFGNILLSKGSPRSYSSRSMGSASISGCGSLVSSKSSFRDSTSTHFCYSTSSGRKSAELVPSRRCSEIMPDRKSSITVSNGHNVGSFTQRSAEDMNLSYGSINRGTKSKSNGSNISLGSGSLLVGSTNGNVMTVGGAGKSNYKHEDVVDHVKKVDNTLLKKAQASSDPEEVKNAGNEYYRRGHFSEALILYTKAVALRPNSAAYRSNRANALSAVGRLGEAVKECEDAISLDAAYNHAHRCVATLYLRLES
ncbi:hypothetical protein KP509_02G088900 [Ceratopteris richardii]|uniref:Uncharacterized protein n=1 Tax=Ceratopteris richardii TaxID=49495 RepID=A0A8T2VBE7_CERRI|nr:hypothetical protein KP509_02G088900 [Ceratopteris richardii]